MDTITIVAYQPNWEDFRRGHVQDRSDSSMDLKVFEEVKDAASFWAKKQFDNKFKERCCSWSTSVLINGKVAKSDDNFWSGDLTEPETGLFNLLEGNTAQAFALLEHQRNQQVAKEEAAKKASETKKIKAAEQKRYELFELLKKEFED